MTTGKKQLFGHQLRVDLWNNYLNKIKNIDIFKSSQCNSDLKTYKNEIYMGDNSKSFFLEEYMFSIIIENDFEENWFTEKILDCFGQYTVPIYIGCPNISDFFNKDGMIICNNIKDIINIANNLSKEDYLKRLDFIKENNKKAIEYSSITRHDKYNNYFGNNNWIFKYYS